jgi:putative transposase
MSRPLRNAEGNLVYHVLNRANALLRIFDDDDDYETFEQVLAEALQRFPTRLLAYCVMPNHFHLVLWPKADAELSELLRWITITHTRRWHARRGSAGSGHLYQGRFRSFPVQEDGHFLTICRYIERNPLSARLVRRAQAWRWGSLSRWAAAPPRSDGPALSTWPVRRPPRWIERVNAPFSRDEEDAVRLSIRRSQPFGDPDWQSRIAKRLGLESTLRPVGRPRKT